MGKQSGGAGAFVYQAKKGGAPREGADVCELKCKRLACQIQKCISTARPAGGYRGAPSDYKKSCKREIAAFDRCCSAAKEAAAAAGGGTAG